MKRFILCISILACIFSGIFAQNTTKITLVDQTDIFKLSPLTDAVIVGSGAALFGLNLYLDKGLHLSQSDFTKYDFNKIRIPTLDALVMQDYSSVLNYISYGTVFLGLAAPALFVTEPKNHWLTIAAMYAETLLWTYDIKELAKNTVSRARPYTYYDASTYPQGKVLNGDWDDSFISGHTSAAFAAATFTSYLFCQYNGDSKYRFAVIGGTYGLAFLTGAFRVASGNHFLSDVVCGAAIGTLTGFLIPYFHTVPFWPETKKLKASITPTGLHFTARF